MVQIVIVKERLQEVFDTDPRNDTEIAQFFGVSKQTISAWKNGSRSPKKSKLEEIAKYYRKNVAWFFDMEETKNSFPLQEFVPEESQPFDLSSDEQTLVTLYRGADDRAREDAVRTLRDHQVAEKDTQSKVI